MKNAHVSPILIELGKRPDGGRDERLKIRLHSVTDLVDKFLAHLVVCKECLVAANHFFLTQACGHILTPKAVKVLNLRRKTPEDGIHLVGIEVPPKATLQHHDTVLIFIAPDLEIRHAVRKFRLSVAGADLPDFSDIGVEPNRPELYRMSSQGHYESSRGWHGKRTVVDILAKPPTRDRLVGQA